MFTLVFVCCFWRKSKQRARRVIRSLWCFSCSTVVQESSAVLQAWSWTGTAADGRWDVPSSRHPLLEQSLGTSQPATPSPAPSTQRYLPLRGGNRWGRERSCSRGGGHGWNPKERRERSQTEGRHKVLPRQQESNLTWSTPHFKSISTPKKIQTLLFYFGQLYFLSSVSGALCSCQETCQPSGSFYFYSDPTTTKHARLFVPSAT